MKAKVLFTLLLLSAVNVCFAGRIKIPMGNRQVITIVHDLPNTDEYKLENGNYVDLATLHEEYNIAYILPLSIEKEPVLVGYDEKEDAYYDLSEKQLNEILTAENIKAEDINTLPFYTRYGGKLVLGVLIVLIIWGYLPSKKEKSKPKNV